MDHRAYGAEQVDSLGVRWRKSVQFYHVSLIDDLKLLAINERELTVHLNHNPPDQAGVGLSDSI